MLLPTPGHILRTEFMEPRNLSIYALAKALRVPATRLHAIVHGKRAITVDTALRLGHYFGMTPEAWIALQYQYDLDMAKPLMAKKLELITPHVLTNSDSAL